MLPILALESFLLFNIFIINPFIFLVVLFLEFPLICVHVKYIFSTFSSQKYNGGGVFVSTLILWMPIFNWLFFNDLCKEN